MADTLREQVHQETSLMARRIVAEVSKAGLDGGKIVEFNREADEQILSKILEAVDGAGLKDERIKSIYNCWSSTNLQSDILCQRIAEAQLQAIKKLFEGEK